MEYNDKLPIFELKIANDPDKLYEGLSLVDEPAIEENFLYFNSDKIVYNFSNDDEMIVKGPALIPNKLIFRNDKFGTRYVYFSAETIKKFVISFLQKNAQKINIQHDDNKFINANVVESYFVTNENNEFDVTVGSWIVALKINDNEVWQSIKSGKLKGFSIQGLFEEIFTEKLNKNKIVNKMSIKEQIIDALNSILFPDEKPVDEKPIDEVIEEVKEEVKEEEKLEEVKEDEKKEEKLAEVPVEEVPVEEVKPLSVEEVKVMINEAIAEQSKLIDELSKKLDEYGKTSVPSEKKEDRVEAPKSFTTAASRFISKK